VTEAQQPASAEAALSVEVPHPPAAAIAVFGDRLPLAVEYVRRLSTDGVQRGLIGPREVPRLWDRHLLNCAVLTDLLPESARIVDVGSGAGLPGIVLALRRPDLEVVLVEPMQRRVDFLDEVVAALGLAAKVRVVRGRADDREVRRNVPAADWVTARAVAPLDRLVKWCLPLVGPGGRLLALKGARATDEVAEHREALRRAGATVLEIRTLGKDLLAEPTWVVVVAGSRRDERRAVREENR
jgi:16S rRNA (guanine527-N7)-methyltransferase